MQKIVPKEIKAGVGVIGAQDKQQEIKGVLCSFIWSDLCQISSDDGICTSHI